MKITHYICPRMCGKTTFAKELQIEDPENTLLYTMEHGIWSWGQPMRGMKWKKIIMDEYIFRYNKLSEVDKHRFIDWIKTDVTSCLMKSEGELVLISTSDKLYNPLLFLLLRQMKNSVDQIMNHFETSTASFFIEENTKTSIQKQIEEMRNKFLDLSIGNLDIVKTNFFGSLISEEEKKRYKQMFEGERYKLDIEGEFLA